MRRFLLAAAALVAAAEPAAGESFFFDVSDASLNGLNQATIPGDRTTMTIAAAPVGAVLDVRSAGMGLNSRAIEGVLDASRDKFNLLGGAASGIGEAVAFSFDRPGVLTDLFFDGVKDESFEFFRLETPGGGVLTLFDSQVGLRVTDLAALGEPNVTLLAEQAGTSIDDDLAGLAIAYEAGQVFTLTYGESQPDPSFYAPGFAPEVGNGARFQGVALRTIPEPNAIALLAAAAGVWFRARRRR